MLKIYKSFAVISVSLLAACAPAVSPSDGISAGLLWKVSPLNDGAEGRLFEADGRLSALIRCQNGLLSVEMPSFRLSEGSMPQSLQLHFGTLPISLAPKYDNGVYGVGRPPANIGEQIRNANEFKVVLGSQEFGPYIPPAGEESQVLASACEKAAMSSVR